MAPGVVPGGMRAGFLMPTGAAVMAVFHGLSIGFVAHRFPTLCGVHGMIAGRRWKHHPPGERP